MQDLIGIKEEAKVLCDSKNKKETTKETKNPSNKKLTALSSLWVNSRLNMCFRLPVH